MRYPRRQSLRRQLVGSLLRRMQLQHLRRKHLGTGPQGTTARRGRCTRWAQHHHASREDFGSYCLVNTVAVVASWLLAQWAPTRKKWSCLPKWPRRVNIARPPGVAGFMNSSQPDEQFFLILVSRGCCHTPQSHLRLLYRTHVRGKCQLSFESYSGAWITDIVRFIHESMRGFFKGDFVLVCCGDSQRCLITQLPIQ
jgi:hypothetical protein